MVSSGSTRPLAPGCHGARMFPLQERVTAARAALTRAARYCTVRSSSSDVQLTPVETYCMKRLARGLSSGRKVGP